MNMTDYEWLTLWHLLQLPLQHAPSQDDWETAKWFRVRIGTYLQEQQEQEQTSASNPSNQE